MQASQHPRLIKLVLIGLCAIIGALISVTVRPAVVVEDCITPPPYGPGNTSSKWKPGAAVTVVFDQNSNFTEAEIRAMKAAAFTWNSKNGTYGNNSGVNLVGFSTGPAPN